MLFRSLTSGLQTYCILKTFTKFDVKQLLVQINFVCYVFTPPIVILSNKNKRI